MRLCGEPIQDLQGTYTYDARLSDNINKAIDAATSRMNFIARPIARGRLRETNQPAQKVALSFTQTRVSIAVDADPPVLTPANGKPIKWKDDGELLDVSTLWKGEALEQTFKADDGQRINEYRLDPDRQTLSLSVTVTSPRLPRPLRYRLVYRRVP